MKHPRNRRLLRRHRLKIYFVIASAIFAVGTSAFALTMVRTTTTPKLTPMSHKPSSSTVKNIKRVISPTLPKPPPVVTPIAPAAAAPTQAPVPAPKPTPKPATDTSQSPAAVASTNTTPGDGVSSLTTSSGSPAPATTTSTPTTTSADPPATCTNTPGDYASSNWAGYFKTDCTYTAVSGKWTVPTPTTTSTTYTTTDAAWIGIGGVSSNDLIQVGTEETVATDGTINAAVFYELLPDAPHYPVSIIISPGDQISATLSETSANLWLISITNATSGQTYTKTISYTSSHSSAEWIEEDPSYADGSLVPFDNFGSVTFTGASATGNGIMGALSDASNIKLVDSQHRALAEPGGVYGSNNDGFTVTRLRAQ